MKIKLRHIFTVASLMVTVGANAVLAQALSTETQVVTSETGATVTVESGMLQVPENRLRPDGPTISIAYYRLRSDSATPGPAVFLLAGGPGASWLNSFEQEERFVEVALYRQFADVVIFDQRGAGHSQPNLQCEGRTRMSEDEPLTPETMAALMKRRASDCRDYWQAEGIDLASYNTDESASDLNDLRAALGYKKIVLVGGSYGSHLGLHYMRTFPQTVDRAIFYGIEGPDHTWDMPSQKLAALGRIAAEAEAAPYYQGRIPEGGLLAALQTVIERVENEPVTHVMTRGEEKREVLVTAMAVRAAGMYKAGKRSQPTTWPDLILSMYNGDYSLPARAAMGMRSAPAPNAMSSAMDAASSISPSRRRTVESDPARSLLGNINHEYSSTEGIWGAPELPDEFRKNVVSDLPVLLVHGTWDTKTPIENAREVVRTLSNGHLIEVVGGTHGALYNLYEHWPPMREMVGQFLQGKPVDFPKQVKMEPLEFPEMSTDAQKNLWDAAKDGDLAALQTAIAAGGDVNALDTRNSRTGRRPLNWAACYDHAEVIKILLASGADINGINRSGFTPVHHAAENGANQAAVALIAAGADPTITNHRGTTPLMTAMAQGNSDISALLSGQR